MEAKKLMDHKYFENSVGGKILSEGYLFSKEEMAIFWSQLCKEQREICYKEYLDVSQNDTDFGEWILNAPEPQIND